MNKVKVRAFSVSLDGFGAGPAQDLEHPLGIGGFDLHDWFMRTAAFAKIHKKEGGTHGVDNDFAARSFDNIGAWVIGRNMFGPVRGPWPDHSWKGWWGEEPPYHVPVFVLTHHARPPLEMKGGTTFHFITDGAEAALEQAKAMAGERDVRIGGGVATLRQYLKARKIDEMHLAFPRVLLGKGEPLFWGIDLPGLGFRVVESQAGESATHVILRRD